MDFLPVKIRFLPVKNPILFLPLLDFLLVKIDMSATDDRLTPALKEAGVSSLFECCFKLLTYTYTLGGSTILLI